MATPTVAEVLTQARAYLRVPASASTAGKPTVAQVYAAARAYLFNFTGTGEASVTVANVHDATRSLLADVDTAGGEEFTDTILQPSFAQAYRELYSQIVKFGVTTTAPATPPASGTVSILDCIRFLSLRSAAHAMRSREGGVTLSAEFDKAADSALAEWLRLYTISDAVLAASYGEAYREVFNALLSIGATPAFTSTPPTSGTIDIEGGYRFLSARTAALIASSQRGDAGLIERLAGEAEAELMRLIRFHAYGDPVLMPFYSDAYRELYAAMQVYSIPQAERKVTLTLTAGDTEIDPAADGLADFSAPYLVEERRDGSNEEWTRVYEVAEIRGAEQRSSLGTYEFSEGKLKFEGATTDRSLRVAYIASGSPPTSGSVGIDDALSFLASRTAAKAAVTAPEKAVQQLGPYLEDQADKALDAWITAKIRQMQSLSLRRPAFRTWN